MTLWGQAKIEVLVVQDEIKSELAHGVPMKRIYNTLMDANQITVSYNSFRRQILVFREEVKEAANGNRLMTRQTTGIHEVAKPSEPTKPKQGFSFNPVAKSKDYFD